MLTKKRRSWPYIAIPSLASAIVGCGGPACKNEALLGLPSPDGALIAFVFYRSCADPAVVTTNVSILDSKTSLRNDPGDVVIVADKQPVKIAWRGPKQLAVTGFKNPTYQLAQPLGTATVVFP